MIGAGFIGLEMAENLAEQGIRVSVVEGAAHVMPPIDMDMAHAVHNYIRAQGMAFIWDIPVRPWIRTGLS